MIQSLQVEGTCLQISQIEIPLLEKIYSQGFIKNFVLSDHLLGESLTLPFYQMINPSQLPKIKKITPHEFFLGYILKLKDTDFYKKNVDSFHYIDLEVTSFKNAIQFCKNLKPYRKYQIFPAMKSDGNVNEMNQFVSWIEQKLYPPNIKFYKKPYDLDSNEWQDWISLESFRAPIYEQANSQALPLFSVIIPHYESQYFVTNTLRHLSQIDGCNQIEVLLIDDGSQESTLQYIQYCAGRQFPRLPLKVYTWGDKAKLSTNDKIFRAGISRNWGAQMSRAERLFFLDADMLVPVDIISRLESSLKKSNLVQFKRLHIPYNLSNENSNYGDLICNELLFVEESDYWSKLFEADDWMQMTDHWKMTCTYAMAIQKSLFDKAGRFRRHFIRYGFEDTDLGFRLSQKNCKFYLDKTPLLHLTQSQDNTQSYFYKLKKINRIQKMAKVFYLSNLNSKLYQLFQAFY